MYQGNYKRRRTIRRIKRSVVGLTLVAVAIMSCFLFFKDEEVQPETIEFIDLTESHAAKAQSSDTTVVNTAPTVPAGARATNEAERPVTVAKKEKETKSGNQLAAKEPASENVYKIKSIAHFYNKPNERTRRKAFINRWNNSYASLTPLDEKNDFVYVEFKNHLGQTSKGWLRKKDLRATKIYENNKE